MKFIIETNSFRNLFFIALVFFTQPLFSQQSSVTGHITDASGKALVGVIVTVKGKNVSTATEDNGNFSIAAGANDVLVITSVGLKTQEVKVNNRSSINISMLT